MKKVLFLVLASVGFAVISRADILNWQIDSSSEAFEFDSVRAFYSTDGGATKLELDFYDEDASTTEHRVSPFSLGATQSSTDIGVTFQTYMPDGYNGQAWNFYVEFRNGGAVNGWNNITYSLADLQSYISTSTNWQPVSAAQITAVPEPTSGLLLLMGGALLALRRKRA